MSAQVSLPTTGPNDLTEDGVRTVAITIAFTVLATIAVAGRVWARVLGTSRLRVEDWLVVAALVFTWGYAAGNIVFAYSGLGVPIPALLAAGRAYQLENQLKLLIANQVTYAIALGFVKTSILLSLIRIFHVYKRFRILGYCTMALCICWAIQTILIAFLICRPLAYNWDQVNRSGSCGNLTAAYVSVGIVDVISDIIIFLLPIPMIGRLKMQRSSKLAAMGLFALGIFTVASGVARTATIFVVRFNPTDSEGATQNLIWAAIEPCIAIIVACLIVIKPLLILLRDKCGSMISSLSGNLAAFSNGASSRIPSTGAIFSKAKRVEASQGSGSESELRMFRSVEEGKIWRTTEVRVDGTDSSTMKSKDLEV